jgi:hypothetical protein
MARLISLRNPKNRHFAARDSPQRFDCRLIASLAALLANTGGPPQSRLNRSELGHLIQTQKSNDFSLTVIVTYYPSGASEWNPIEHRLCSEINKNWAAEPLVS